MRLVISVKKIDALRMSRLSEQVSPICEHVAPDDDHLLLTPVAGRLMALLEILKEEGIAYHFQYSRQKTEL